MGRVPRETRCTNSPLLFNSFPQGSRKTKLPPKSVVYPKNAPNRGWWMNQRTQRTEPRPAGTSPFPGAPSAPPPSPLPAPRPRSGQQRGYRGAEGGARAVRGARGSPWPRSVRLMMKGKKEKEAWKNLTLTVPVLHRVETIRASQKVPLLQPLPAPCRSQQKCLRN